MKERLHNVSPNGNTMQKVISKRSQIIVPESAVSRRDEAPSKPCSSSGTCGENANKESAKPSSLQPHFRQPITKLCIFN